jgi:hypothetical protein
MDMRPILWPGNHKISALHPHRSRSRRPPGNWVGCLRQERSLHLNQETCCCLLLLFAVAFSLLLSTQYSSLSTVSFRQSPSTAGEPLRRKIVLLHGLFRVQWGGRREGCAVMPTEKGYIRVRRLWGLVASISVSGMASTQQDELLSASAAITAAGSVDQDANPDLSLLCASLLPCGA